MAMNMDTPEVLSIEKINELEEVIESSPSPRFGGNTDRRIIDMEEIFNLLGDLKVTIPEDVRKADSIISDAKNITAKAESYATELVNNAQARADAIISEAESKKNGIIATAEANASSIIAEAEAKRENLLDEHDIMLEAEHRADLLERKAEYNAKRVYDNAKEYADGVLGSLMQFLEEYYGVVEVNRKDLGVVKKPDFNESPDEAKAREETEKAKAAEQESAGRFFGLFKRKKKVEETVDDDE
jgi:cell division septum initiation protein DivIVA